MPQNGLDYVCICGDINLNITDKRENNDFIWPCIILNDLLSQVVLKNYGSIQKIDDHFDESPTRFHL